MKFLHFLNPKFALLFAILLLFFLDLILPFSYNDGSTFLAKTILFSFSSFLCLMISNPKKSKRIIYPPLSLFYFLIFSMLLGSALYSYDKLIINNYDYDMGLSYVRHFMNNTRDTSSISSPYSFLGNLLMPSAFILIALLIIFWEKVRGNLFLVIFSISSIIITILTISVLSGGRSSLFLLFSIIYFGFSIRKINELTIPRIKLKTIFFISIFFIASYSYINYIFFDRAQLSDNSARSYSQLTIEHLNGQVSDEFYKSFENKFIENTFYFSTITGAYVTHSTWIFQGILDLREHQKINNASFYSFRNLLSKISLTNSPRDWYYKGYFAPFVGIFIYDYGLFFGILIAFCFIYFMYNIASRLISHKLSHSSVFVALIAYIILLNSFYIDPTNIMMVPLLIFFYISAYQIILFIINLLKLR